MNRLKKRLLYWVLGDFIVELQAVKTVPEALSGLREFLQILRDIRDELKLIRATG